MVVIDLFVVPALKTAFGLPQLDFSAVPGGSLYPQLLVLCSWARSVVALKFRSLLVEPSRWGPLVQSRSLALSTLPSLHKRSPLAWSGFLQHCNRRL